ncbi:MAG: S9 family peptidase [Proteobacteria bacterium]|jgi:dipeptidyl aminopeptidase/acylaminoacyl peptidase|nr:S9 family peptidase [Pseudomonadota bacterium]
MDRKRTSTALFAVIASLLAGAAAAAAPRTLTVEDLYRLGRVGGLEPSPSAELVAFTVKRFDMEANRGVSHVWIADLASGAVRQLTSGDKSDFAPRWLPDGRLAFLSARSEPVQVFAIAVDGGEAQQLTHLPVGIDNFAVSKDGRSLAAVIQVFPSCDTLACTAQRAAEIDGGKVKARVYDKLPIRVWDTWLDARRGHVFWVPLAGGEPRDLTPGELRTPPIDLGGRMDLSIAPDGSEVAFTANVTRNPAWNTNNDVFAVPTAGGVPQNITGANAACDAEPIHSPDGAYIAYLTMTRPGFEADRRVLVLYDRKSKKRIPLTDSLDSSVSAFSWAPSSRYIVFTAQERGRESVYKVSVPSGVVTRLVAAGMNADAFVSADGGRLVFLRQTATRPTEVWVADSSGAKARQLSHVNDGALAGIEMGALEEFEFAGAGGDKVHGFLLKPPGFDPKKKYPLLLLVHGGPQGAFGDEFHFRWNLQMFATPGFVVAAINFHGSTGYGQAFTDSISGDWGGKPYDDLVKGIDFLVGKHPFIDGGNVSAAGASYGGFMINWMLGHTDRFRSLVSHDGVFNQISMYGSTEELWFPEWEYKGTPWDAPELYAKHNPVDHVGKFKTPTLVVHGENDFRVPYGQGLELFTALQRKGVESKLLLFPDENHFVQRPQNARLWWNTVLEWLASHAKLKWTPPGKTAAPAAKKPGKQKKKIAG